MARGDEPDPLPVARGDEHFLPNALLPGPSLKSQRTERGPLEPQLGMFTLIRWHWPLLLEGQEKQLSGTCQILTGGRGVLNS